MSVQLTLPPAAIEALRYGQKIEAIKIVREANRCGLKEAKDAVEMYESRGLITPVDPAKVMPAQSAARPDFPAGFPELPREAIMALQRGELIEAIKLLRKFSGVDLKAAKDAVDNYRRQHESASFNDTSAPVRSGMSRSTASKPATRQSSRQMEAGSPIQEGSGGPRFMLLGVLLALILLGAVLVLML